MKGWVLAFALLAVVAAAGPVSAEKPAFEVVEPPKQLSAPAPPFLADDPTDATPLDPEVARLSVQLEIQRLHAQIARTRFAIQMDDYQAQMYRHHQFWTDAAAVAVYIITFFGLLCAAAQFRLVDRLRGRAVTDEDSTSAGAVELPGGAKVSSPFLGVIVLFISLGFFYLYLTNVYPIMSVAEIEAKRVGATAAAPPADPGPADALESLAAPP